MEDPLEILPSGGEEERKYWELIQYLLRPFSEAERKLVLALAVFRWFDKDITEYLWYDLLKETQSPATIWRTVQRLPFVESFPDRGITFHELYRKAILTQLWHGVPDFYRQTARMATKYFQQFTDDIAARVERAYHLFVANPPEARDSCIQLMMDFQDNGQFGQWHTLNQGGLEHLESGRLDPESGAVVLESTGRLPRLYGSRREAIPILERAIELYRSIGDKESEAGILYSISYDYNHEGFREKAIKALERAYQLFLDIGNIYYAADSKSRLGEMFSFSAEVEKAYKADQQAVELFRAIDEPARQAEALFHMAGTGFLRSEEQVLELYHAALPLFRRGWERYYTMQPDDIRLTNPLRLSRVRMRRWRLYRVAVREGDCLQEIAKREQDIKARRSLFVESQAAYQRALKLALEMLDLRWIARTRLRLGDISTLLDRLDDASDFFKEALNDALKIGHKLYTGWAYKGMGDIAFKTGNRAEARTYYLQARDLYLEIRAYSNIRDQIEPMLALLDAKEG